MIAMSAFGINAAVWVVLAAFAGLIVVSLLMFLGFVGLARYKGDSPAKQRD